MNTVRYKIGRNDPCSCGSGKKYKKCCMTQETILDDKSSSSFRPFIDIVRRHAFTQQQEVISYRGEEGLTLSDIIIDYAADFLSMAETPEDVEITLTLAIMAWNIAVGGDDMEDYLKSFAKEIKMPRTIYLCMKNLLEVLAQQKRQTYPFIDKLIADFKVECDDEGIKLSLLSVGRSD